MAYLKKNKYDALNDVEPLPMEERFFPEDHGRKHAAEWPHVQAVVVHLVVHQQLGPLEVPARHPHVVLLARVVKLRQTPIYQSQSPVLVINHHVVWLHVSVHDSHTMAVV